jgi:hypothetical protein
LNHNRWSDIRRPFLLAIVSCAACGMLFPGQGQGNTNTPDLPANARGRVGELQLEIRVPFEPTAFPSSGHTYLTYELHLTNVATNPITLRRVEVMDGDGATARLIAAIEGPQLDAQTQSIGQTADEGDNHLRLTAGQSSVVFMWLAFDSGIRVPNKLLHRVLTDDFAVQGPTIGTHYTKLRVLGSPVQGPNWLASDGPSIDQDNHHRRGLVTIDGRAVISRRYAIDWMQSERGSMYAGDPLNPRSYHSYDEPVFAVADGRILTARDGLPDNVPGHGEEFHPAVPITFDTVAGNTVVLDLGDGQYAHYMHLESGSLRVKTGDRVRRGQELGRIGDSGDARAPHLHFEVTTSARFGAGEGVPYLIERYRVRTENGHYESRTRELPLRNMSIDFGPP